MQLKLTLPAKQQKQFESSAYFNGVKFVDGETVKVGEDLVCVLDFKDPQNLANMFLKVGNYDGSEKEAHLAMLKKKADEKAATAKKKAESETKKGK